MKRITLKQCVLFGFVLLGSWVASATTVGGFWGEKYKMLTCKWLPHCIHEMEKGGAGEELLNLVATGEKLAGKPPSAKFKGCMWSDAYPYNIIEAACLALEIDPGADKEWAAGQDFLRRKIEEWIPIFLAAQEKCGYVHSFHDLNNRPHFSHVSHHEFYVMGYFIDMGIAHYRMTGGKDRRLLDAAIRCADHLCDVFGPAPKRTWMNGHPGIEMSLQRLSKVTGDKKYAELARFFVLNQHSVERVHDIYNQSDKPAVEMREAWGHAVRANYFYTAMADIPETQVAANAIWNNIIDCKYYLTGGTGTEHRHEAYGVDYHLPQCAYAESCAGCGLAFFARRMARTDRERAEAVYERVLYNNILGGVSRDGTTFYYQNPLEQSNLRTPWHQCPCCVGNIPRTLFALKDNLYRIDGDTLYIDHYMDSEKVQVKANGEVFTVTMKTGYPFDGKVKIETDFKGKIMVRFPWRTESKLYTATPDVKHGYFEVGREFELPLPLQTVTADERVEDCRGRVAYQKGPLVMSTEWAKDAKDPRMIPNYDRLNDGVKSEVWVTPTLPLPLFQGVRKFRTTGGALVFEMPDKDEAIYGLGDNQTTNLNLRGHSFELRPRNQGDGLPVVMGVSGWGVYVDDPSVFQFDEQGGVITFRNHAGKPFDYYVIRTNSLDGVVAAIRGISGDVPKMPDWAFGFWQSKERYASQDEIVGVVRKYRELGIPLTGIIQDWQYWGDDAHWNAMEFLNPKFPDPKKMIDDIHAMDCKFMISIWQSFGPETKAYAAFKEKDLLLPFVTWPKRSGARLINVYRPEARELYWRFLKPIAELGVDAWWMDSTDPDHFEQRGDWDYVVHDGKTWRELRGNYPVCAVKGVYEHMRRDYPGREFFILTRGAGLGQQAYGSFVWSGDVSSTWDVLQRQIPSGLNYSLTGNPYFNCDLGGFFAQCRGNNPKRTVQTPEWRELYVRWMQLGTFLPMMRSHGCGLPREVFLYGKKGEEVYDALVGAIKLRYELMPYILQVAKDVSEKRDSFMRPLSAEFPKDRACWDISREFMLGHEILVSPVLEPGVTTHRTYLPAGADWVCAKTGKTHTGGQWIEYPVTLASQPFFRKIRD